MHDLFRLFKQSVEKKIWQFWLVEIAVMKLHNLIWSSFEIHLWLSERLEISFISVSDICDFVLNVKLLCFFTIHNFQHILFFSELLFFVELVTYFCFYWCMRKNHDICLTCSCQIQWILEFSHCQMSYHNQIL